jgi:hypothetical protein
MAEIDPVKFGELIAGVDNLTGAIETLTQETKAHKSAVDNRLNKGHEYFIKIKGRMKVLSVGLGVVVLLMCPMIFSPEYVILLKSIFSILPK